MKGFISQYWSHAYHDLNHTSAVHLSNNWDVKLVEHAIGLYKGIWEERNKHIHGNTRGKSQKLQQQKVQDQVTRIYQNPPGLASRFPSIKKAPLKDHLNKSTTHLKHWISRINHQVNVSNHLQSQDKRRQHSILSFCQS
jgi:hypothetical protein